MINPELYPYKELESNPHIIAGFTKRGGHCGHFTGGIIPKQWFTEVYWRFLDFIEK
jgi:predicted alpha/beta-fold hydrolase